MGTLYTSVSKDDDVAPRESMSRAYSKVAVGRIISLHLHRSFTLFNQSISQSTNQSINLLMSKRGMRLPSISESEAHV